jgi:hypothetical protein
VRALTDRLPRIDADAEVVAWAASGAMSLTGRPDRDPLGPPAGLVTRLAALQVELAGAARVMGATVDVDPLTLLGERAAIAGLHRRGATSVGGATRLLPAEDGWIAVSLARPDDVALVPAWLELDASPEDPWHAIERTIRARSAQDVVARGRLLGLPIAGLRETRRPGTSPRPPVIRRSLGSALALPTAVGMRVIELGSLWAGPLCGSILAAVGATVIKVESSARPDGARSGPSEFFDLLNAGKHSVAIDLSSPAGVVALTGLLAEADVVIEASRPRALEQLGIDAKAMVRGGGPPAWVSITGHGREEPARDWVAFGDDAAVAGGLVVEDADGPVFCADAVADPITGLVAAGAALQALHEGGRWLLDIALSAVAACVTGPTLPVEGPVEVAPPRVRATSGPGPRLGEHNARYMI